MVRLQSRAAGVAMIVVALCVWTSRAQADVHVFACEPEWGALAQEVGGTHVGVYSATTGQQDPHMVQARPGLISRMHLADVVFCTGVELEIGWLPLVLVNASNGNVQPGSPGYLMGGDYVHLLDVNPNADRALGDAHAVGNHHIITDPRNVAILARVLAQRLELIDPANASYYAQRAEDFLTRWSAALQRWQSDAAPLRGVPILVFHRNWPYLFDWLGIVEAGTLEPKPGIPPSTAHLNDVMNQLKAKPARMVIWAAYEDPRPAVYVSERTGIPAVELPYTVGGTSGAKTLFDVYDETVERLLVGLHGKSAGEAEVSP